jgi:hypothetical protein
MILTLIKPEQPVPADHPIRLLMQLGWFDPSDRFQFVGGQFDRYYKSRHILVVRERRHALPSREIVSRLFWHVRLRRLPDAEPSLDVAFAGTPGTKLRQPSLHPKRRRSENNTHSSCLMLSSGSSEGEKQ